MCFRIGNEKLLEKHKTIWTNIEGLRNIKLNALPVYDDKYIKTQVRTYGDKLYTNFCGLNLLEDGASFLLILYLFMKTSIISKYI